MAVFSGALIRKEKDGKQFTIQMAVGKNMAFGVDDPNHIAMIQKSPSGTKFKVTAEQRVIVKGKRKDTTNVVKKIERI